MQSLQDLMLFLFGAAMCYLSTAEVIRVAGYQGSEVQIICPYREGYGSNYQNYLCKGSCGSADVLIETQINWPTLTEVIKMGRYSVRDDTKNRVFPVTITGLQLSDAGQYWCGVNIKGKVDLYTEVQLEVAQDRCCADHVTTVQGYAEGPISIRCPYTAKHRSSVKYFCRGNQSSTCWQNALVTSGRNREGRLILNDDRAAGEFTVNMSALSHEDSGRYLCGFHSYTSLDHFSALHLEVKEWCCVKTVELNGTEGHPIDIQCLYPPKHKLNAKFFCKGEQRHSCDDIVTSEKTHHTDLRLSQDNNSDSNQFLVTITALRAQHAGTYWCGSDKAWSAGNYTNIHLSVSLPQLLDTTSNKVSHSVTPVTGLGLLIKYVKFIVPAVLGAVLVATLSLAIIFKNKCNQDEVLYANTSRRTEHMIHGSTCGIQLPNMELQQTQPKDVYANQDTMCTNTFQGEDDIYENTGVADDIYENTRVSSEC